jgi:uncharacterized protein (TIGR02145 family)
MEINMKHFFLLQLFVCGLGLFCKQVFSQTDTDNTVKDIDGNVYKTVKIGNQVWMTENLRTTKFNDSKPIAHVPDSAKWGSFNLGPAYCWYNNKENNGEKYGALYNYYTVRDISEICPVGWHKPDHNDWDVLITYLTINNSGNKLKESGVAHWTSPNSAATNETGFTALPGGCRESKGTFLNEGMDGYWWIYGYKKVDYLSETVWFIHLAYDESDIRKEYDIWENNGLSIRCIKD